MAELTCDQVRDLAAAYVLDALEPAEAQAVAGHLASCPQSHEEMAELGGVVPYLAETGELIEPPPALRGRILAAAARDLESRAATIGSTSASDPAGVQVPAVAVVAAPESTDRLRGSAQPPVAQTRPDATQPIPFRAPRRVRPDPRWLVGIAAVLAIAVLGVWNISLQRDLQHAQAYEDRVTELLALAGSPGTRLVILSDGRPGPAAQPNGLAVMPAGQPGRLVVTGLAPTTGSQAYETWAIVEGQAPVPIGSFTVGSDGLGYFAQMPEAPPISLTVAITLEPTPDMTLPTGPIVSSGVLPAES